MDLDAFLVDLITLAEEVTKNQPGLNDICFVGYIELISVSRNLAALYWYLYLIKKESKLYDNTLVLSCISLC